MFTQATIVTTSPDTTTENFLAHAAEGKVQFHRERSNGTTRRVHFLAEGTKEREYAEWVRDQREEGRTMKALATETHFSIATLRRWLNDLALTEAIEESEEEELAEMLQGAAELAAEAPTTEQEPEEEITV